MSTLVKICGLRTPETVEAAIAAGADMVGLVFFPRSPRNVSIAEAKALRERVGGRALVVALTVDADDALLDAIRDEVRPDIIQLHGHETPERTAATKARTGLPVMKAIGVAEAGDLAQVPAYAAVSDRILFDAKPPRGAVLPGGNGVAFDWRLLAGLDLAKPFMLSGGLEPGNVAEALRITGAPGVDVSSGVERAPGDKDPERIAAFVKAARGA
ncbi:N-(5'-phosphoribosyl)anthranilate isomerase [Alsobacter metallidurans]|uniref:N-(5'-phosphoribosyl)anthranilate isomerase n=1 Tax=Alsobacter metallidurans TaxID=340221 RepID=A0A917MGC5_9HYPH|nr:phosphoribosylanthranilate isomerase [Alsobacter metallidurans]GGH07872.1 N-(5'-phosphoribosyl)anthranilate isomerase [Alsobacter metallidurans]